MGPRTEEVRQFIEIYDVIRTDKTGPLSRRDLDWDFLTRRFDNIFELSHHNGKLIASRISTRLVTALGLRENRCVLQDFLPQVFCDDIDTILDKMLANSNQGVLATFRTAPGLPLREYEFVLLPAEADGSTSAIGTIGAIAGRPTSGADLEAERKLIASLRLQDENCFDLRQRLLTRMGGMLVQCIVSLKEMMPGGKPEN